MDEKSDRDPFRTSRAVESQMVNAGDVLDLPAFLLYYITLRYSDSASFPPDIEEFRSYLEKRFDFEQVTVKKFRTWAERRQFNRDMKRKQAESERPILPANQKLITLSVQDAPTKKGKKEKKRKSHWVQTGILRTFDRRVFLKKKKVSWRSSRWNNFQLEFFRDNKRT